MQDLLEQIIAHARSAWRYRWPAIATAWVVCLLGWGAVGMLDDVYEAEASVYVDTTSELRRLLDEQIIEPNVEAQLQYVRQALLGRVHLEAVARSTDLLVGAKNDQNVQKVIDRLLEGIQIQTSSPPGRNQTPNLYKITYQNHERSKALAVVNALLNSFVEDTLRAQQNSSETSRKFLVEQIRDYEQRLATAEQRLADFNRRNFDRLPGRQGSYFERLQNETAQLEQVRQMLREARSKRDRIDQQVRGEAPWVTERGEVDPASIEGRIIQHQTRLEELLLKFTENHPDVIAVRETLNRLQAQREQQQRDGTSAPVQSGSVSNNPVYQALLISRNEVEADIARLQADLQNRERRVGELRELIDEMPDVEAELARLNRDYDVIHAQYQSLLNSLERERLTREAMRTEQVDFRVISPPTASTAPVFPPRMILLPVVLLFGFGAGGGLAVLLSLIKPVFNGPAMLESMMDVPVIGTVGHFWTTVGRPKRFRAIGGFVMACLGLIVVFSGVFVVEVFGPGFKNLI